MRATRVSPAGFLGDMRITCGVSEAGEAVLCSIEVVASGAQENMANLSESLFALVQQALPGSTVRSPSPTVITAACTA